MSSLPPRALSEVGEITRLVVKHARDAFGDQQTVDAEWRAAQFHQPPGFLARRSRSTTASSICWSSSGARLQFLPKASGTGLDSIYVRDASVVCDRGVILAAWASRRVPGSPPRKRPPTRAGTSRLPARFASPGCLEGGDVVWLDSGTIVVGRGYRTNDEGIRQLRELLGASIDELIVVPLPHWKGPGDVFHLMSILSPVDDDLAVVYSPLMPVPLRERLLARGMQLVEVPHEEFESMGANVLAIAPRRCIMVAGSPRTRALLERAGAEVLVYSGAEISLKGGGGPTCLTRPIARR